MKMNLTLFLKDEDGAVTVDWVVLTAAIVGLGVAIIGTIANGALDHSNGLGTNIDSMQIAKY
ncbi:MAG: Flp family type IVb pilin [Paracoccaceae bacterium]